MSVPSNDLVSFYSLLSQNVYSDPDKIITDLNNKLSNTSYSDWHVIDISPININGFEGAIYGKGYNAETGKYDEIVVRRVDISTEFLQKFNHLKFSR